MSTAQLGRPLAQVALAWASAQPGITSLIVGASRLEQLPAGLYFLELQTAAGRTVQKFEKE